MKRHSPAPTLVILILSVLPGLSIATPDIGASAHGPQGKWHQPIVKDGGESEQKRAGRDGGRQVGEEMRNEGVGRIPWVAVAEMPENGESIACQEAQDGRHRNTPRLCWNQPLGDSGLHRDMRPNNPCLWIPLSYHPGKARRPSYVNGYDAAFIPDLGIIR